MSEHTVPGPADKSNNVTVIDQVQFRVELVERLDDGSEMVLRRVLDPDVQAAAEQWVEWYAPDWALLGIEPPSHPYVRITPLHSQVPVPAGGAG